MNKEENDFKFLSQHGLYAFLNSDNDIEFKKVEVSRAIPQPKKRPTAQGIRKKLLKQTTANE